jgi:hypothetical protein
LSIELSEERKRNLEEIVQSMNKEAEMALLYDEGTQEREKHLNNLLEYKEIVRKLDDHAQTFVHQGLLDNKDIHDFYWPELESEAIHNRQKAQHVGEGDRSKVNMEYRRQ